MPNFGKCLLHVPHKDWSGDQKELENYAAIERWVHKFYTECSNPCLNFKAYAFIFNVPSAAPAINLPVTDFSFINGGFTIDGGGRIVMPVEGTYSFGFLVGLTPDVGIWDATAGTTMATLDSGNTVAYDNGTTTNFNAVGNLFVLSGAGLDNCLAGEDVGLQFINRTGKTVDLNVQIWGSLAGNCYNAV